MRTKIEVWVAYHSNPEWVRMPSLAIEPKKNWQEMQIPLLQLRQLQEEVYAIKLMVKDHIFHISRFQEAIDLALQQNSTVDSK